MDRPENHRDDQEIINLWLPGGPHDPCNELLALMIRPTEQLQTRRPATVSSDEWNRRVLGVGRTLLQLLAIQYELGEPLDLNGDLFLDLVEENVNQVPSEFFRGQRAMILAMHLQVLRHRKFWDSEQFYGHVEEFNELHTTFDPTYRPANYLRLNSRKRRHPVISIEGHSQPRIRRREE
ncbi:hypothetical protein R3P38DRAFT_2981460, partial [Favolaschia claudopus]